MTTSEQIDETPTKVRRHHVDIVGTKYYATGTDKLHQEVARKDFAALFSKNLPLQPLAGGKGLR